MIHSELPSYKRFPCVTPSWDNTARRKSEALILHNSTPAAYGRWLQAAVDRFVPPSPEENLVFVNAWNEGAEGNPEPCQKWGRAYPEETRTALDGSAHRIDSRERQLSVAVAAATETTTDTKWGATTTSSLEEGELVKRGVRAIAFYLPQFHPIPENDAWWGKGFTEWTNVASAEPFFRGHDQPRLPADLGFYDLRVRETRIAQAAMAQQHGIEGFCYWHYWFHGQRLLDRPFNEVVQSGEPDFPFCLAWANESWSRSWLGDQQNCLMEQRFSEQDELDGWRRWFPILDTSRSKHARCFSSIALCCCPT